MVPGTHTAENHDFISFDQGNRSSISKFLLCATRAQGTVKYYAQIHLQAWQHANKSTMYLYDCGGNMTSYSEYAYTTGTLDTATKTINYVYGDMNWKDKVTSIDGKAIAYDAIGNPLTYDGWTFTWKAGRMLASMVKNGTNAQFTYDHNGLRIKKVVNGVTTNYTLNGKNVVHMTQGGHDLHFFYDAQDKPTMVRFNGTDYFYVYNLQGDVVAMIDANGTQVVEYYYDAWGAPISKTGTMAATLGTVNPFRYRGYVYDEETGLYYLRSRYYHPFWKRFINADAWLNVFGVANDTNVFAYCRNSPVGYSDKSGCGFLDAIKEIVKSISYWYRETANILRPREAIRLSSLDYVSNSDYRCYGFVLGVKSEASPSGWKKGASVQQVYQGVVEDVGENNIRKLESMYDEVEPDEDLIALRVGKNDFHFMKKIMTDTVLSYGTQWEHKIGKDPVRTYRMYNESEPWKFQETYDSDIIYFALKKEWQ